MRNYIGLLLCLSLQCGSQDLKHPRAGVIPRGNISAQRRLHFHSRNYCREIEELRKYGNPGTWVGRCLRFKPLISALTPGYLPLLLLMSLPQVLELQSERQDVVFGRGTSFQVT